MKGIRIAAASTAAVLLGGASAFAADLSMPVKAVPISGPTVCTSIVDFFTTACQVSAYGVRFYGTIDIGGSYMTNPTPLDRLPGPGVGYFPLKNSGVHGAGFTASPNGMSYSGIGLQINENLGGGWRFVGQVEAAFLPTSFNLGNNPGSVQENAGLTLAQQKAGADGSAQGSFYNQFGYAGFSHDTWGTLTFGRQNNLAKDAAIAYDPFGNAFAFSYIGFFGATAGGGDTEDVKSTTAIKYRLNVANFRFGFMSQFGGYDAGNPSNGMYQGDIGGDFHVGPGILSLDVVGSWTKDAVSEGLVGSVDPNGVGIAFGPNAVGQNLLATISNNTSVMVAGRYTWDRLKLYAGYEWIQFAKPSDDITSFTDINGQFLSSAVSFNGVPVIVNSGNFNFADKVQQTAWVGARYAITSSLDAIGSYTHVDFGAFASSAAGVPASCATNDRSSANCHGTVDSVAFALDWQFAPKWDTYLGTLYTKNGGSQANGFVVDNNWSTTAGVRFRW